MFLFVPKSQNQFAERQALSPFQITAATTFQGNKKKTPKQGREQTDNKLKIWRVCLHCVAGTLNGRMGGIWSEIFCWLHNYFGLPSGGCGRLTAGTYKTAKCI